MRISCWRVQAPAVELLQGANPGAWVAASFDPFGPRGRVDAYAMGGFEALAMNIMPRIARTQSMDILSSHQSGRIEQLCRTIWPRFSMMR